MQPPTIPLGIAAVLPLFATMLSSWLAQDQFPKFANALIAFVALVGTAIACVTLAGNFTGNAQVSILATLGYVAVLMQGDLSVLYEYLVSTQGPLNALKPPTQQPDPNATIPRLASVPPRASAQNTTQQPPTTGG